LFVKVGIAIEDYGLASGVERRRRRAATSRVTTKRRKI